MYGIVCTFGHKVLPEPVQEAGTGNLSDRGGIESNQNQHHNDIGKDHRPTVHIRLCSKDISYTYMWKASKSVDFKYNTTLQELAGLFACFVHVSFN